MELKSFFLVAVGFILGLIVGRISAPKAKISQQNWPPKAPSWPEEQLPLNQSEILLEMIRSGRKIEAIKYYKELTNCSLKAAKEYIDQLGAEL